MLATFRSGGDRFADDERLGLELVAASGADVLIESTPLTHGGELAISHVEAAFDEGLDVVTVNKGPIAWAYRRLRDRATERGSADAS